MPDKSPDPSTGAIMTPVYLTSTYVQDGPGEHKGFEYSRTKNPTRLALEGCLAALEGAQYGAAFASGVLPPMRWCICSIPETTSSARTTSMVGHPTIRQGLPPHGIQFTFADLSKPESLEAALTPQTKMIWVETPTNRC